MAQNIRDTLRGLGNLFEDGELKPNATLKDVLRPWLVLTGLEMQDMLHHTWEGLTMPLLAVHTKLAAVIDVLDEDQAQEAACRVLKNVDILGEDIEDDGVVARMRINLVWEDASSKWLYTLDPKLRQRSSAARFVEARDAVLEMLERHHAA